MYDSFQTTHFAHTYSTLYILIISIDFLADKLPTKQDYVVWIQLSEEQRRLYSDYVESGDSAVANVLSGISTSPLEAVTWLKKL